VLEYVNDCDIAALLVTSIEVNIAVNKVADELFWRRRFQQWADHHPIRFTADSISINRKNLYLTVMAKDPVTYAVEHNDIDTLTIILEDEIYYASLNALLASINKCYIDVFKLLLAYYPTYMVENNIKIYTAAIKSKCSMIIIGKLLYEGYDFVEGTCLLAIKNQNWNALILLQPHDALLLNDQYVMICLEAILNTPDITAAFKRHLFDIIHPNEHSLYQLAEHSLDSSNITAKKKGSTIEFLLAYPRYDPKYKRSLILRDAIDANDQLAVKLLLKDGRAMPKSGNNYSLRTAVKRNQIKIVQLLLADGRADPTAGHGILDTAVNKEYTKIIKLLLNDGRDRFVGDKTILLLMNNHKWNILEMLLQAGIPIITQSLSKNVRSMFEAGIPEQIAMLLIPYLTDKADRENLFLQAAVYGYTNVIKTQLTKQIDPSFNNNTTFIKAAGLGHINIVKLLLKDPRVDPHAQNDYALKWARKQGHNEIVQLIQQH
jgi:hypothetical protein